MSIGVCGQLAFSSAVRTRKVENPAISADRDAGDDQALGREHQALGPLGRRRGLRRARLGRRRGRWRRTRGREARRAPGRRSRRADQNSRPMSLPCGSGWSATDSRNPLDHFFRQRVLTRTFFADVIWSHPISSPYASFFRSGQAAQ